MPEIDWRSASREERQILYRFLKAEMDTRNMTLFELLEEALGTANVGQGYDANMRSGRFNRKHAFQFYKWLIDKNAGRAESVLEKVLHSRQREATGAWSDLVRHDRGGLAIIEHPERQLIVQFANLDRPFTRMARGTPFFLKMQCPADGFAIGFQQMNSIWYQLPLGREAGWVSVQDGENNLPRGADGTVDPLVEEIQTGPARFVTVFSVNRTDFNESADPTAPLSRPQLDTFANSLDQDPPPFVLSSRVLIT
ncbi:MAG: hypothetical protein HLUCCA12_13210 [Rhodobacteraceae bacterium HLUCCA12]|nr:MAG: hypothetical protein HLUCCA12_13210 [Rhodobacteraceae bacterium HLUCCA12]